MSPPEVVVVGGSGGVVVGGSILELQITQPPPSYGMGMLNEEEQLKLVNDTRVSYGLTTLDE